MMLAFCLIVLFLLFFIVQRPKRKMMVTKRMEDLPQELVFNILSRMPAKELLKYKCVCKSWFNIITDPHFITNHYVTYNNLIYSQNQMEHLLVIRGLDVSSVNTYISLHSWSFNDPKKQVSFSLLDLPDEYISDQKYWTEIMGPCNGIYFLKGNPNLIMNPSLKQFKALPKSHLTYLNGTYSQTYFYGFGFDSKTNDYKVVLLKKTDEDQKTQKVYWTVELYSLNTNSWRKLDAKEITHHPIEISGLSSPIYTYVNNCYHWWGYVADQYETGIIQDVVLAFNMVDESFRKIKVPKFRYSNCFSEECFKTLAPSNDSDTIRVIVYPLRGNEKCFDVWLMKDYLDERSWIKQYSVGPVPPLISKFVGFDGSNRIICKDKNERLVLYDPYTKNTKELQVYGKHDSIRAVKYMESLVLLQKGSQSSN